MNKWGNNIFIILIGFVLIQSCASDFIKPDSEVCFQEEVLPIFQSSCTQSGCHNSTDREAGYIFNDYSSIVSHGIKPNDSKGSEVYKSLNAIGSKSMPRDPYNRLSDDQILVIKRWIDQGAKNTTCSTVCDSTDVTYSGTIKPILQLYCYTCHAGNDPLGGVNYNNYDGVKITVNDKSMLGSIKHLPGYFAMPQSSGKLPACKIAQIEKWIRLGALNN